MTVSWPYAIAQIAILDRIGFPKSESCQILDIEDIHNLDPTRRLAAEHFNKIFDAAETILNDPLIGLRAGYEFRVSNFAKTGSLYNYCEDLTDVLKLNARYQPIAVDIGQISTIVETDDADNTARYFLDYDLYCKDFHAVRHVFGLIFGAYATTFRWLVWSSAYELKAVYFQQDMPVDRELVDKIFQCPVYFNQAYNRIEFFEESMTAKFSTYDPVRKAQIIAKLGGLISSREAQDSFQKSLRKTVEQAIIRRRCSLPHIAEVLGVSEGKLRRDLKAADIKYRVFLDDVRKDMFEQKFAKGLSFSQIAQELGYNDQAAFTRAFRRWHGVTPGRFMTEMRGKESV